MLVKRLSIGVVMGMLVVGCGAFQTKESGRSVKARDKNLIGSWKTDCYKSADAKPEYTVEVYKFSALGDFDKVTILHTDDQCKNEAIHHTVTGTYEVVGDVEGKPNTKNINFTVQKSILKADTDEQAKHLNDDKVCDRTDWPKGKEVNITGLKCLGEYKDGDVIFDIYERDNKSLYFGKPFLFFNKQNPSARPMSVDTKRPFFKS